MVDASAHGSRSWSDKQGLEVHAVNLPSYPGRKLSESWADAVSEDFGICSSQAVRVNGARRGGRELIEPPGQDQMGDVVFPNAEGHGGFPYSRPVVTSPSVMMAKTRKAASVAA